jgi:hypothetical protein
MLYKPDWDQAKARLIAYWNHAIIDRACIAIHAPRDDSRIPPAPDLHNGPWLLGMETIADSDQSAIEQWWQDPDLHYKRAVTWFENTYFAGEALPITYVNWGAMAMAAMFGSPPKFNKTSVWYAKTIDDWKKWDGNFDPPSDPTWKVLSTIEERLVQEAPNKFFVGKPELGNGADVLSLIRGMDDLAMDLINNPQEVKRGVDIISNTWVKLMEQAYRMTSSVNDNGDVLAWMGLWAPGRIDQIACDFSSIISPTMFREFFVPEVEKMGNWCEYGVYHLDGPACMKNMLDELLKLPQIKAIQFTPGAGSKPTYTPAYIPRYRKVLESGRNLYLLCQPAEVEKILAELPPEGLFMRTYVSSQDEAEEMLKKVNQWSARGNQFPVSWHGSEQ